MITELNSLQTHMFLILIIPMITTIFLGINYLLGYFWDERNIIRYTRTSLFIGLALSLSLISQMIRHDVQHVFLPLGHWFSVGDYHFEFLFMIDQLSLPLVILIFLLSNVIGKFSSNYLIGEQGIHRFFFLMNLFISSILIVTLSGTIDLLFSGWELVGVSSILLIGFYPKREMAVKNSFQAFIAYRIGDVGILTAAILMHYHTKTAEFPSMFQGENWPYYSIEMNSMTATYISLLLVLASIGKSSQFPLCGWLPKAMEGPTPSSAIFYGALSIHLGPYLLLRCYPFIEKAQGVNVLIFAIGLITAIYGSMVGRTRSDVKTALAYATMTQVGLIFVEISLGLKWLPIFHICSHASLRTFQYLRSASLLQDFVQNPLVFENQVIERGEHYNRYIPKRIRIWLYYFSLDNFFLPHIIQGGIKLPLITCLQFCKQLEDKLTTIFDLRPPND